MLFHILAFNRSKRDEIASITADLDRKNRQYKLRKNSDRKETYSRSTIFIASAILARCSLWGTLG